MKTKLAITSAAALLAGTLLAAAQTPQPGGMPAEQPPQGAETGVPQEGSSNAPRGGGTLNKGTVGSGQQSKQKAPGGKSLQPGGVPPAQPPEGNESASPNPR